MRVLRAFASLIGFVLLVAAALAGLGLAVFTIQGDSETLSLPNLADLIQLDELEGVVGGWLEDLEGAGTVAILSALAGAGAMIVGVLLVLGALAPTRERRVTFDADGAVSARRRALEAVAASLARSVPGVTEARARVRARRRSGGRLGVRAGRTREATPDETRDRVQEALRELTEDTGLRSRVRVRHGDGSRAQ